MCFFAKWYFLLLCFLGVKNDKNCKKKCKNIQADIGFTGVDILAKLCVAYVFGLFQTMCLFVGWFVCLGKRAIFVFFACFARVRLFPFPCYWYCWCDRMRGEFVSIKMRSLSLGALCYKTSKPISESTQELETEWGTNACQAGFDSREPSAHPHAQAYNRQQSFVPNNANGAISLRTTSKGECQPSLSAHFFFLILIFVHTYCGTS